MEEFQIRQRCIDLIDEEFTQCREKVVTECGKHTVRAAKVLRMRMSVTENVLKADPDIRVIHMIRDPRAIMLSRVNVDLLGRKIGIDIKRESLILCRQLIEDYNERQRLEKVFPGSFLQIKYEDLAMNLVPTLFNITQFLHIPYNKELEKSMLSIMHSDHHASSNEPFNQSRENSTNVALAWKKKIDTRLKDFIDAGCSDVYKLFGYHI